MVASIIATTATGKSFKPDDFDPYAEREPAKPKPEQTWQQQLAVVEAFTKAAGGVDMRPKGES